MENSFDAFHYYSLLSQLATYFCQLNTIRLRWAILCKSSSLTVFIISTTKYRCFKKPLFWESSSNRVFIEQKRTFCVHGWWSVGAVYKGIQVVSFLYNFTSKKFLAECLTTRGDNSVGPFDQVLWEQRPLQPHVIVPLLFNEPLQSLVSLSTPHSSSSQVFRFLFCNKFFQYSCSYVYCPLTFFRVALYEGKGVFIKLTVWFCFLIYN